MTPTGHGLQVVIHSVSSAKYIMDWMNIVKCNGQNFILYGGKFCTMPYNTIKEMVATLMDAYMKEGTMEINKMFNEERLDWKDMEEVLEDEIDDCNVEIAKMKRDRKIEEERFLECQKQLKKMTEDKEQEVTERKRLKDRIDELERDIVRQRMDRDVEVQTDTDCDTDIDTKTDSDNDSDNKTEVLRPPCEWGKWMFGGKPAGWGSCNNVPRINQLEPDFTIQQMDRDIEVQTDTDYDTDTDSNYDSDLDNDSDNETEVLRPPCGFWRRGGKPKGWGSWNDLPNDRVCDGTTTLASAKHRYYLFICSLT